MDDLASARHGGQDSTTGVTGGGSPNAALVAILIGNLATTLNNSVVGVALPDISRDFGDSGIGADWIVLSYLLGMMTTMAVTSWLGDTVGKVRGWAHGLTMFVAGSALTAAAPTMIVMVIGRVIQGMGSGIVLSIGMAMVYERFEDGQRGRALGIWGFGVSAAPAAGPPVGGFALATVGWRWLFVGFVAAGVVAFAVSHRYLVEIRPTQRRHLPYRQWLVAVLVASSIVVVSRSAVDWGFASATTLIGVALTGIGDRRSWRSSRRRIGSVEQPPGVRRRRRHAGSWPRAPSDLGGFASCGPAQWRRFWSRSARHPVRGVHGPDPDQRRAHRARR